MQIHQATGRSFLHALSDRNTIPSGELTCICRNRTSVLVRPTQQLSVLLSAPLNLQRPPSDTVSYCYPRRTLTPSTHSICHMRQHSVLFPYTNGCIHCNLLTYLLTPWSRVLLEKLTASAASQEIPRIFGTLKFITLLTSARHLSLSWANSIQSPQPPLTSWRSILILSSHLRLGLPIWYLTLRFPHQNPVYASPLPYTCYMPHPSHSSRFYHPNNIW